MAASGKKTRISKKTVWFYRGLAFATASVTLAIPFLIPGQDSVDPLEARYVVSGLIMTYGIATFFSKWVRSTSAYWVTGLSFVLNSWLLCLAFFNDFSVDYVPTYFIILCLTSFVNRRFRWLIYGYIGQVLIAFALFPVPQDPLFSPIYFYLLQVMVMTGVAFLMDRQLIDRARLIRPAREVNLATVAAFEYLDDGILVTDRAGKIVRYNPRFLEMWNLRREDMDTGKVRAGFDKVRDMIIDLRDWESVYLDSMQHPTKYIFQAFALNDGRRMERFARPLYIEDEYLGRIWFYKDVTEAKRKQEELELQKIFLALEKQALAEFAASEAVQEGHLEKAFTLMVQVSSRIFGTERGAVWLRPDLKTPFRCIYHQGFPSDCRLDEMVLKSEEHPEFMEALEGLRVLGITDISQDQRFDSLHQVSVEFVSRACIQIPLRVKGEMRGIVVFQADGPRRDWTPDELGFAGSLSDVATATLEAKRRRTAETDLANSVAILTSVFEMSGVGIVVTDLEGDILDFNADFVNMWDLQPEHLEAGGMPLRTKYIQDQYEDHNQAKEAVDILFQQPDQSRFDRLVLKDGRILERTTRGLWVRGEVKGRIWYYLDITRSEKSRRALRRSVRRNRALVKSVPDLMLLLKDNGDILDYEIPDSPVFHQLFKNAPRTIWSLFPMALCRELQQAIQTSQENKELVEMEAQLQVEGVEYDFEIRLVHSGEQEFLAFVRDDTQRKTIERELIQRNFELDSFVYRASHDLKAPLNSLMGLIDILAQESIPPEIMSYIRLMDRSVVKLDTFIRNLTDFSRITRLEIQDQTIDFRQLYDEILESLQYMEHSGRVEKKILLVEECPLHGDRFHIGVVLANLLSNAIKYQDHQKAQSEVKLSVHVSAEQAVIEIRDNGIGIPSEHQKRLFELFYRASNQSFGSGMGLYITKNAIEKMNGSIHLESTPGEGTCFFILLPNQAEEELET